MATSGSAPKIIATADLTGYIADAHALGGQFPNDPIFVRDTGELANITQVGDVYYLLGPEYVAANYGSAADLSVTTVLLKVLLPVGNDTFLTSYDVYYKVATTNDGSNYWDITLSGYGGDDTHNSDTNNPDTYYPHSLTDTAVNVDSTFLTVTATKHGDPGTLEVLVTIRLRDIIASTNFA